MRYYRRAWFWDLEKEGWIPLFDGPIYTKIPPGLSAYDLPQPYILEHWWRWENNKWVHDDTQMNYPPFWIHD